MVKYEDRVYSLQYETLLDRPEETCRALCAYLEIPYYQEMIDTFSSVTLQGEMGDPTGVTQYKAISSKPLEKWKESLTNPIRKSWCRSYVTWLGKDRLERLGYDQDELFAALDALPFSLRRVGGDIARGTYGFFYQMLEFRMLSDKLKRLPALKEIYPHM
jgi:hypothetical protein